MMKKTMMKKNVVQNTSKVVREEPAVGLMIGAFPGGIEASERRGQLQFLDSEILPAQIQDPFKDDKMERGAGRRILESWGFRFGKVCGGDTLFQQAKLPEGWSKKGSDHDMWSDIVDEKGRERCAVFYKAAFYDRKAHMEISDRFRSNVEYEDMRSLSGRTRGIVKDGERVVFTCEWRENPMEGDDYTRKYGGYEAARKDASAARKAYPTDLVEQWARP